MLYALSNSDRRTQPTDNQLPGTELDMSNVNIPPVLAHGILLAQSEPFEAISPQLALEQVCLLRPVNRFFYCEPPASGGSTTISRRPAIHAAGQRGHSHGEFGIAGTESSALQAGARPSYTNEYPSRALAYLATCQSWQ